MKRHVKLFSLLLCITLMFGAAACGKKTAKGVSVEVNFNLNYLGAVGAPVDITVTVGKKYGQLPSPARTGGFVFGGWFYNKNCTDGPVTADTKVEIREAHTLYAKWNAAASVRITFDPSGGTFDPTLPSGVTDTDGTVWRNVTVGGTYLILPAVNSSELDFLHWETEDDAGNKITVESRTVVTINHDHTVYAVWKPVKDTWNFNDPSDIADFTQDGLLAFGNQVGAFVAPISYDADEKALKIINVTGDDGIIIHLVKNLSAEGYTVTYKMKVVFPHPELMTASFMFRFRFDGTWGNNYDRAPYSQVVSVNQGGTHALPTNKTLTTTDCNKNDNTTLSGFTTTHKIDDGMITMSYVTPAATSHLDLTVNIWGSYGWTDTKRTGLIYYVYEVSVKPPVA